MDVLGFEVFDMIVLLFLLCKGMYLLIFFVDCVLWESLEEDCVIFNFLWGKFGNEVGLVRRFFLCLMFLYRGLVLGSIRDLDFFFCLVVFFEFLLFFGGYICVSLLFIILDIEFCCVVFL